MRPIKLTLSAFGPYAGAEEIDFREAVDAGLFGIYGPTGSGKSSIFSAMTFALFGEGAKREQSIMTMRSQHADPDRMTEVSFLFEMGGRRYYIRRQPDQARPKKRGDGETIDSHAAWLFDATDIPIDEVTADNCGVVLAEKKVGEVSKLVRELLGYGAEQFRQIVLLPQGRFEKFLLANSDERVAILRDLFDVSLYRDLTKRMRERSVAAKKEFEDGHRVIAQRLSENDFVSTDDLTTGIERAIAEAEEAERKAVAAEAHSGAADRAHNNAEAIEAQFNAVDVAKRHRSNLEEQSADIEAVGADVEAAESAQKATDLQNNLTDADKASERALLTEFTAREAATTANRNHDICEEAFATAEKSAGGVDALVKQTSELERYRQSLVGAADLKIEVERKTRDHASAKTAFDTAETAREGLDTLCKDLSEQIEVGRRDNLRRAELTTRVTALREEFRAARAYLDESTHLDNAASDLEAAKNKRNQTAILVGPSQQKLAAAEQAFIGAQAQMLAGTHLIDGQPCPVCGSANHPAPAKGDDDPKRLERDMIEVRKRHEGIVRDATIAEGAIAPAERLVTERTNALADLSPPRAALAVIEKEGLQVADELSSLGDVVDLAPIETSLNETRSQLTDADSALALARATLQGAATAEAVAARSYQDAISGVPDALRADSALDAEMSRLERAISALRDAVTVADKQRQDSAIKKAEAATNLAGASEAVVVARDLASKARDAFTQRLDELGLSLEQFQSGVARIPQIVSLRARVEKFRGDVALADAKVRGAEEAIAALDRPDLVASATNRDAARADALAARRVAAETDAARKVLLDLRTSLLDQLAYLETLERETGPLRALADAFAGDNAMKTPLETFAIGAMFDHVLDAANLRLGPMTAGRYRFERDIESVGGRSKRGLDVRVHDIETGRSREISTLSGGETFIAALSLALGLADIVEMSHGQISLDTIFIDEGFGSLDTDNDGGTLDRVLQVLQDIVSNRRAVGLISHVPMVQQAVPNGFSIIRATGGSRIQRRAA